MALDAPELSAPPRPSWNPLRCGGTELPVPLVLGAKLVALALLLTNHVRLLPTPFLPFIPGLDRLPPDLFQHTLQATFVVSAVALLLNRRVRAMCLVLGVTLLLAVASSKAYYGNNKTFCGLLLVLTGLYEPGASIWIFRAQLALVYFGAGFNKLLDPDWQSGLFFDYWATARIHHHGYMAVARLLPPLAAGKLACWTTIATELGLSAAFLVPGLSAAAIWGSVLFQSALLVFTGTTFTMFFYGMQAALLAVAPWPRSRGLVLYDGDCAFCTRVRRWMERADLERAFDWRPYQSGAGRDYGLSEEALRERLHLVVDGRVYTGFRAFQILLLYNPVFYFTVTALIAAAPDRAALYRQIVVVALVLFFLPAFRPIGEKVYLRVARNRGRLAAGSTCGIGEDHEHSAT